MRNTGIKFKFNKRSKLLNIDDLDPQKIQVDIIDLHLSKKIGQMSLSDAMKKFR
jgi:hypothetical protein